MDNVSAISPVLMERKGGINPHMTFAPEGVDFALYSTPVGHSTSMCARCRMRSPATQTTYPLKLRE